MAMFLALLALGELPPPPPPSLPPPPAYPPHGCPPATLPCAGRCLELVTASGCPASTNLLSCDDLASGVGGYCEADGECGTANVNNCFDNWDVYKVVAALAMPPPPHPALAFLPRQPPPPPVTPPPPPPTPFPPTACRPGTLPCERGCLRPIPSSRCPSNPDLKACNAVAIGALCEADGECQTANLNNCLGQWDVYEVLPMLLVACFDVARTGVVGRLSAGRSFPRRLALVREGGPKGEANSHIFSACRRHEDNIGNTRDLLQRQMGISRGKP